MTNSCGVRSSPYNKFFLKARILFQLIACCDWEYSRNENVRAMGIYFNLDKNNFSSLCIVNELVPLVHKCYFLSIRWRDKIKFYPITPKAEIFSNSFPFGPELLKFSSFWTLEVHIPSIPAPNAATEVSFSLHLHLTFGPTTNTIFVIHFRENHNRKCNMYLLSTLGATTNAINHHFGIWGQPQM